ncbi:MAG: hypothetical protein HY901_23965 [Deltaproteobacteria bacterium]|nr:hypothetical protein [Deltaproteobacteria bacterium]
MSMRIVNRSALAAGLALAVCSGLGGAGCKDPVAGLDATVALPEDASAPSDAETPQPFDAGTPDSGPQVIPCSHDEECPPSQRCSEAGACIAAVACGDPSNCAPMNPSDTAKQYCNNDTVGLGCRCVKEAGAATGYCKRRLAPCMPCETDEQCGNDETFFRTPLHEPGKCVSLGGTKVCLEPYVNAKCGCGQSLQIDSAYYCAPQGEPASCADLEGSFLCCSKDANCPPEHPLCDTAHGRCQDLCWYDYDKDETIGCRADRVCHVDPKFLTPTSRNYGAGRCGLPCSADEECRTPPYGRGDFICKPETHSDKRCRPEGCLADMECPYTEDSSWYLGYCERATGVCICAPGQTCNCRTGNHPVTAQPYRDCKEGYLCEEPTPGADGQCREKNCYESGGAQDFCAYDDFCCGEDIDQDPQTPPPPCIDLTGQTVAPNGECYEAPAPWCAPCDVEDAKSCTKPGFPTSPKDANLCFQIREDLSTCFFACNSAKNCPKGFICRDIEVDCSQDPAWCGDPARCQDTGRVDSEGNPIKWCTCTTAGAKGGECPLRDPNVPDGPEARCSDGASPFLHCIWTHGCIPQSQACKAE